MARLFNPGVCSEDSSVGAGFAEAKWALTGLHRVPRRHRPRPLKQETLAKLIALGGPFEGSKRVKRWELMVFWCVFDFA